MNKPLSYNIKSISLWQLGFYIINYRSSFNSEIDIGLFTDLLGYISTYALQLSMPILFFSYLYFIRKIKKTQINFVLFSSIVSILDYLFMGFFRTSFFLSFINYIEFLPTVSTYGSFLLIFFSHILLTMIIYLFLNKKIYIALVMILLINLPILNYVEKEKKIIKFTIITSATSLKTNELVKTINSDIIVFPESSFNTKKEIEGLKENIDPHQLIIGGYRESLVKISKAEIKYYRKSILFPINENFKYRPIQNIINMYTTNDKCFRHKGVEICLMQCYEAMFPSFIDSNAGDLNLLLTSEHRINSFVLRQHFIAASIVSASTFNPTLRVAKDGFSGFFKESGRLIFELGQNKIQTVNLQIPIHEKKKSKIPLILMLFSFFFCISYFFDQKLK